MSNRVAIYIRVSTNYQIDKDSLPMQREDLTNYAKYLLNTDDYEIFEDAGYSGKNTQRPGYQEMMNKIRKKKFTHLLVWKIDRISRNLLDFSNMYEELKKYGVTFISKNEQFDTSTAMGEAMLKIILVFAELERKLTSERVSATMMSRALKGLWNGANVPLGYKYDHDKKYPVPDENEAGTVKKIFDRYLKDKSCLKVAKYLNDNHYPTKRGGNWNSKTVSDILRNPFYIGTYRYNYRESGRGPLKPENEWIIIEDNHDPIIDKDVFIKANSILDSNQIVNGATDKKIKHTHVFARKLVCMKCGSTFVASRDRERNSGYRPSRYRCGGKAQKHICDAKIVSDVGVGPFVFTFLKNIVTAMNTIETDIDDLREILIKNMPVDDIEHADLELLYIALYKIGGNAESLSVNKLQDDKLSSFDEDEYMQQLKKKINKYKKDKEKYSKAIERLDDLFLFSDEGMKKSDYILRKKEFEEKLEESERNLSEFYKMHNDSLQMKDMSFLSTFENFIFNDRFKNNETDYVEIATHINVDVLRDLIDSVISKIYVLDDKITSISFQNGLTTRFIYLT